MTRRSAGGTDGTGSSGTGGNSSHDDAGTVAGLWAALGGGPELPAPVAFGPRGGPGAAVPVMRLARGATACCALAAAELLAARTGGPAPAVTVEDDAVATAFTSERHLLIDGRPGATFAPLSRFWPAADGWLRTHANYPHHRARLLAALGVADHTADADTRPAGVAHREGAASREGDSDALVARVAEAIAAAPAAALEEAVYAAGGLAVAVRTTEAWSASGPGRAAAARPLVEIRDVPAAPGQREHAVREPPGLPRGGLPAAGVRVLDLTRVIAGPVATRTLALLGADVLRVDSPRLPELADAHADTGFGKRSTALDLAVRADREVFEDLLATADVVVTGYRPGALDRHGLSPDALLERRPGLVVAQLSAWGFDGPWADRRGFDSLVQAACGIALLQAAPDGAPGALPGQFLDHGTGYLIAAAVLRSLTERYTGHADGRVLRFGLAATAARLLELPAEPRPARAPDPLPYLTETASPLGRLRHARPAVRYSGSPTAWSRPPGTPGGDPPRW